MVFVVSFSLFYMWEYNFDVYTQFAINKPLDLYSLLNHLQNSNLKIKQLVMLPIYEPTAPHGRKR